MDVNIKVEHSNIQEICRTCTEIFDESILIPAFDQIEITTKTNNEFQLADELISLNVQIGKDDGLPQQVCISCVKQLTNIHTFRLTCKKAQVKLKELFLNDNFSSCSVEDIDKTQSAKGDKSLLSSIDDVKEMHFREDKAECDSEEEVSNESNLNLSSAHDIDESEVTEDLQYQIKKEEPCFNSQDYNEFNDFTTQRNSDKYEVANPTKGDVEDENVSTSNKAEKIENGRVGVMLNSIKMCHDCNKYVHTSRYKLDARDCEMLQQSNQLRISSDSEFCCFYCDEKFNSLVTIGNHILKFHPKDHPYQCKMCNEYFSSLTQRRNHFEKKHETFKCDICNKIFKNKYKLSKHRKGIHANDGKQQQSQPQKDEVQKQDDAADDNNIFITNNDKNKEIHKCDMCSKEYKSYWNLKSHQKLSHADGNYECSVCFKQFTNSFKFDYHLKKHDKSKQYKCQYCEKTFMQTSHLRYHEENHTNTDKPYVCENCGKRFLHRCDFRMHVKSHEENVTHVCEICGKGFPSQRMFNVHKKTHICDNQLELFDEIFNTENDLKLRHSTHPKEKDEKSQQQKKQKIDCEKAKIYASRYREKTMQLNKFYICPVCRKSFTVPSALDKHMKVHDKNRKFGCDVCGNFYKTSYHLQSHMNRVHLKDKHYDCPICRKRFYDSCTLNFHVKCHSKAKCKYCNEKFSKSYIKAHERTHTQEKSHICLICGEGFYHSVSLTDHNKKHTIEELREMSAKIVADNLELIA